MILGHMELGARRSSWNRPVTSPMTAWVKGKFFRAAPSDKSRQLQLQEYAEEHPGRLASRLLRKMRTLLAREEGAMKDEGGQSLTPSTATSYFLTVMVPTYQDKMNLRMKREMKTVARALDQVAAGLGPQAADTLAQRLKALELQVSDQSWGRAQHLELLPPEGAALVDKDETYMATKEQAVDVKMRTAISGGNPKGKGKEEGPKGKGKKGKGGHVKGWGGAQDTEKAPPAWDWSPVFEWSTWWKGHASKLKWSWKVEGPVADRHPQKAYWLRTSKMKISLRGRRWLIVGLKNWKFVKV